MTTNNKEKDLHGGASICLLDFDGVNSQSFTRVTRVHLKCQVSNRFGHLSFECEDT